MVGPLACSSVKGQWGRSLTALLPDAPRCRAVPALEHAAPAVPAELPQPIASPRPLGMLTNALGRATKGLQEGGDADSPINGLLYVSGNITGSSVQPTGEVAVRLYDAAVGEERAGPLVV